MLLSTRAPHLGAIIGTNANFYAKNCKDILDLEKYGIELDPYEQIPKSIPNCEFILGLPNVGDNLDQLLDFQQTVTRLRHDGSTHAAFVLPKEDAVKTLGLLEHGADDVFAKDLFLGTAGFSMGASELDRLSYYLKNHCANSYQSFPQLSTFKNQPRLLMLVDPPELHGPFPFLHDLLPRLFGLNRAIFHPHVLSTEMLARVINDEESGTLETVLRRIDVDAYQTEVWHSFVSGMTESLSISSWRSKFTLPLIHMRNLSAKKPECCQRLIEQLYSSLSSSLKILSLEEIRTASDQTSTIRYSSSNIVRIRYHTLTELLVKLHYALAV